MTLRPAGLHHVSALSAHIGGSRDFYTRVLGMRPLITTVNQDDPRMYHLFFGDGAGSPGSEMTVFDMPRAAPERRGNNSISLTTFRVAGGESLVYWQRRFAKLGVPHAESRRRDRRHVLDFQDPVGTRLSLVDDGGDGPAHPWGDSPVPARHQLRGLGNIQITVPALEPTEHFLCEGLGLRRQGAYPAAEAPTYECHVFRMVGGGVESEVHVVVRDDLPRARYGSGGVHHVALRVPEMQRIEEWAERLQDLGYINSGVVERFYFRSVYVREPNQVLFELATDGPGFEVDGPLDAERLKLPPFLEPRRAEIEAGLEPLE